MAVGKFLIGCSKGGIRVKNNSSSGGVGFLGVLTIVFGVLKLTHVINWSWWLVLSPSLLSVAIIVVYAIVIAVLNSKVKKVSKRIWRDFDDFR